MIRGMVPTEGTQCVSDNDCWVINSARSFQLTMDYHGGYAIPVSRAWLPRVQATIEVANEAVCKMHHPITSTWSRTPALQILVVCKRLSARRASVASLGVLSFLQRRKRWYRNSPAKRGGQIREPSAVGPLLVVHESSSISVTYRFLFARAETPFERSALSLANQNGSCDAGALEEY